MAMLRAAAFLLATSCADARVQNAATEAAFWEAEARAAVDLAVQSAEQLLASSPNALRPPTFPLRWVARANVLTFVDGKPGPSSGDDSTLKTLAQDGSERRLAQVGVSRSSFAPAEWDKTPLETFNDTLYFLPGYICAKFNGAPLLISAANSSGAWNLFGWLPASQDGGKVSYKGRELQAWQFQAPKTWLRLLVDEANLPVLFEQNVTQGASERDSIYEFVDFSPDATLPWVWDGFQLDDFLHPAACPDAPPTNITMYIFHPKNEFNIAGQDLADVVGDTVYVCSDIITNQTSSGDHDYAWLSQYELEVLPSWGQYQNCNGYNPPSCLSGETFRVGHEAAYYLGRLPALDRQCGTNPLVGEWYSLPPAGQCKEGARPGDGSCTWRIIQKVKTIDGQCLFKGQAFRQSCVKEARAPFAETRELFKAAFAGSDPSSGGCPPIADTTLVV